MSGVTAEHSAPPSIDREAVAGSTLQAPPGFKDFVLGLELVQIQVINMSGERRAAGQAPQTKFDFAARWQVEDLNIFWRYEVTANLTDEAGMDFGSADVTVLVTGATATPPAEEFIQIFGSTSGLMIAHPYLRESIASITLRLGFTGVLLPILKSDELLAAGGQENA